MYQSFFYLGEILALDLTYFRATFFYDDEVFQEHEGAGPGSITVQLDPGGYTDTYSYGFQWDSFSEDYWEFDIPIAANGTYHLGITYTGSAYSPPGAPTEFNVVIATEAASGQSYTGLAIGNLFFGSAFADTATGQGQDDDLFGMDGDDTLVGGGGDDVLNGGAGADRMTGGTGDDIYYVDSSGDRVVEAASAGLDFVYSSVTQVLRANVEQLQLTGTAAINGVGNELVNRIYGNTGNNVLDGGAGADYMAGRGGNDTYVVDNIGDQVDEGRNAGTDAVRAWISYTLTSDVEKLSLQGTADLNGTGNGLANTLIGNAGNNILDGRAGADIMTGGAGNDTFIVDNSGDRASEDVGGGIDTVQSSVTHMLKANVENLTLTGVAAINAVGNGEDNILTGNGVNNILDGGAGADQMAGGAGNDTYVVENVGDVVTELAGGGTDSVRAWISYTLGDNLEKLSLYGTADIDGTGNELANHLYGNAGSNVLDGGLGADTLTGGGGGDTYRFSTALGPANVDRINVFDHAADTIQLDGDIFAALSAGALAAGAFNTGPAATQADDRILFDAASKSLYYDADGVGGVAAVKFATFGDYTGTLDNTDFFVV